MLGRAEDAVSAANRLSAAAKKGDETAVQGALKDGRDASNDVDRIAMDLGLKECGGHA